MYSLVFWSLIEWFTPPLRSNVHSGSDSGLPYLILLLHIPLQVLCIVSLFYGIGTHHIEKFFILSAALSTGLNSGASAIVVSHEWIHRSKSIEKNFGKFLLFTAGNVYFFIEHLSIHHRWVGTDKDHVTARYNESLYSFFIRSVKEQIRSVYKLENRRLAERTAFVQLFGNYLTRQVILHALLILLIFYFLGTVSLVAWLIQCILANFMLEYVNYIQHYGLKREPGQKVDHRHSWDSNQFASRFVLVDLSRHSDHHMHSYKPYHNLDFHENSPKLPSGYAGMFFVAGIPFLWRKVMHAKLKNALQK